MSCNLGVGCEDAGICYARAHGAPERCGANFEGGSFYRRTVCPPELSIDERPSAPPEAYDDQV